MCRAQWVFLLVVLILFGITAANAEVEVEGTAKQGGLLIGSLNGEAATVSLDGTPVPVAPDGRFLLGFGRDAAPNAELNIAYGDGRRETRVLTVAQRDYKVQRIDGLPQKQVTPDPAALKRIRTDNAAIGRVRAEILAASHFASGFQWPVMGPVTGVFGSQRILNGKPKNPHNGTDVAAPAGTVITAPADGVVALADPDMFYTGKTVMLDHGLGLTSVYAHMSAILVTPGQVVKQGTPIGRIGQTGRVTGPHLHWGVTWQKTHLDPMLLTGPMPAY